MRKLYVIDGPMKGKSFNLNDDITTIGRSSDNDICISDMGVSQHHARLLNKDDSTFIVDLNSFQGTFIDGEKIEPGQEVEIEKESDLAIGNTILSFQKKSSGEKVARQYPTNVQGKPSDTDTSLLVKDSSRTYIRSLELLLKVSNIFAQSLNVSELLDEVIDQIFNLLKRIDRGAILLLNKETGKLQEVVSKTRMEDKDGIFSKINYSRTIVNRTIKEINPVMMSNTSQARKTDLSDSIEQMNIMSVMCVPLTYKGEVLGVIYVDSIGLPEGFRKDDLQLLTGIGNTAAIAIENARMYTDLEKLVDHRTKQLKNAKNRLQESESRFRAVFENMSNGVAILDKIPSGTDFVIKDFNKAAEKIDKINKDDIIGKNVLTVFPDFKDIGLFDTLKRVWETGKPEHHPTALHKHNRATYWRKDYVYRLPNGEVVLIYEDVTSQKRAIESQRKLQNQLSHSQKMESLGRMAGGVAHNFRNILQAILGNSQFLQMAHSQDELTQRITKEVNESVKKGSDFIDSLLKFSRHDIKKGMSPLNLKDVLAETYKIISNTFDKKIRIINQIEDQLPMIGDHLSLNQVFINLCNNARDAMPDGGVLKIEAAKEKNEILVSVSDTGYGMNEETLKKIFDPFFTTKDVGEGTGLGLSITQGIIEEHKGSISVSSQPGKGTTFKISFPLATITDDAESESKPKIRHGKEEKILIVDDDPAVLKGLEKMVKAIGYEADSVSSGSQAIKHYKMYKPDLVLLDWKMPVMDGAICAKKILEDDPAARIVIITGYQETAINEINAGVKDTIKGFIIKPCTLEELSQIISQALKS